MISLPGVMRLVFASGFVTIGCFGSGTALGTGCGGMSPLATSLSFTAALRLQAQVWVWD